MVTKRISLTLAALVGIGCAIGQGAGAQVIVQTFTIPSFPDTLTFQTFNTSLGLLGAITFTVSDTITSSVKVFNGNATLAESFTGATATVTESVTAPGPITITDTASTPPPGQSGTVAPLSFLTLPPDVFTNTSTSNVPIGDFGLYENPPTTFPFTVTASVGSATFGGTETSGNGDLFFGGTAAASGSVTLTYFYQPAGTIPEPGATTFVAAGVLGSLGMVLRRRRKA